MMHPTLGGGNRENENERRSPPGIFLGPNMSAVTFDDRAADRQTHAESLRLCGENGFEKLLGIRRGDALAVVRNTRQHLGVLPSGLKRYPAGFQRSQEAPVGP